MSSDREKGGGGLSLQTLLISSLAAVTAASLVPMFWEQGTLFATAMTPIVVALASEAFRRPAERITAVAPRVARRTATGAAVRRFDPDAARTRRPERVGARGDGPERLEPPPTARSGDPFGLREPERRRRPRLQLALATGLLAFVAAAAVVTASELAIFGGSVSGERGKTSLFGGERRPAPEATPTATPEATPEAETTPEPAPSATPDGEATPETTPSATATPLPPEPTPSPVPTP